jgi:tetratricopeptide (TPR) repeat protein/predicted Ser/Thr protein kinase
MEDFPRLPQQRAERLMVLALAKGWIRLEDAHGGSLADLVEAGLLTEAQAEALEGEIERGQTPEPEARVEGDSLTFIRRIFQSEPSTGPGSSSSIFTATRIERWAHFENLTLIAEGGMGRIFKAMDARLRRRVALKLLRREDPELQKRFLKEAELQAKVEHPHVCRVYEAGEWQGQAYIAMQLIQGDTLKAASSKLSFSEKLRLMIQVCEGVQAAHKEGLIHRDLKPGNLMVEEVESGLRATVLDFGLARTAQTTGLTQSGMLMGTVQYMSPEQARGEDRKLDRRTDVYALGATLYELFTGAPPFADRHGLEAVASILSEDPLPLHRRVRVPVDLDTVVMKCLEKDPQQRYDSARALGDELQRVLDGDPILARRASLQERTVRWARKNKALMTVAAIGLLGIFTFAGWGVRERIRARARAEYAQRFGQEAERIEALVRFAQLQPMHDLRPERLQMAEQVKAIPALAAEGGALAEAPAAAALGRALWAMGDADQALAHLQRAWDLGLRSREVAFALGRARGRAVGRALDEAALMGDPALRSARIRELQARSEAEVIPLLRQGKGGSLESAEYQEALLAYFERRFADAEMLAAKATEGKSWFFEGGYLRAMVQLAMAKEAASYPLMRNHLAQADAFLSSALEHAPSAIGLRVAQARIWKVALVLGWQQGQQPAEDETRALEALKLAERLDPDSGEVLGLESWVLASRGRTAKEAGLDPRRHLAQAIQLGTQALAVEPEGRESLAALLFAQSTLGSWQLEHGEDPRPALGAAAQAAKALIQKDPTSLEDAIQGVKALTWRMLYEGFTGLDPTQTFQEARDMVEQVRARAGALASPHAMAGALYASWAFDEVEHGKDPREVAQRAVEALSIALDKSSADFSSHTNLGSAWMVLAHSPGQNPEEARRLFGKAIESYGKAIQLNPRHGQTMSYLGRAYELRAELGGPGAASDRVRAMEWLTRSTQGDPLGFEAWLRLGELHLWLARGLVDVGEDARSRLVEAERCFNKSLKRFPTLGITLAGLAEVEALRAKIAVARHQDPQPAIRTGRRWVSEAIARDPRLPRAHQIEAQLKSIQFAKE